MTTATAPASEDTHAEDPSRQVRSRELQSGSIPEELHAAIIARDAMGEAARDIAQWLRDTKGVKTSHASVARLLQRLKRQAAQQKLREDAPQLLADLDADRLAFNAALDTMAILEDYTIQRVVDGKTDEDRSLEQVIRICHRRATLLDRRLRSTTQLLMSCGGYTRTAPQRPAPVATPDRAPTSRSPNAPLIATAAALLILLGPGLPVAQAEMTESGFERLCTGSARPSSVVTASEKYTLPSPLPLVLSAGRGSFATGVEGPDRIAAEGALEHQSIDSGRASAARPALRTNGGWGGSPRLHSPPSKASAA